MKILFTTLPLWAILFYVVKVCNIDMLNIMLMVQFVGKGILRTQQFTKFLVPLYSNYNYISPASLV
jgi:hypothetical protein